MHCPMSSSYQPKAKPPLKITYWPTTSFPALNPQQNQKKVNITSSLPTQRNTQHGRSSTAYEEGLVPSHLQLADCPIPRRGDLHRQAAIFKTATYTDYASVLKEGITSDEDQRVGPTRYRSIKSSNSPPTTFNLDSEHFPSISRRPQKSQKIYHEDKAQSLSTLTTPTPLYGKPTPTSDIQTALQPLIAMIQELSQQVKSITEVVAQQTSKFEEIQERIQTIETKQSPADIANAASRPNHQKKTSVKRQKTSESSPMDGIDHLTDENCKRTIATIADRIQNKNLPSPATIKNLMENNERIHRELQHLLSVSAPNLARDTLHKSKCQS